ncbi:MAG: DUF2231 domain-containing protein [Sulfurimonas sp.]
MNLPSISLPNIELSFGIPLLMHPPVDHFAVALPIVILLIEVINLFVKKRAISVLSLFLIVVVAVAVASAYLTGSVDGKEAYPLLSEAGQSELKEHKLLGTYLVFFASAVVFLKLLSMMLSKGLVKAFYFLILILFIAAILKQGKDGGELVYEFGANVEAVKILDDEKFDLEEELEELQEELEAKNKELETKSEALEEAEKAEAPAEEAAEPAVETEAAEINTTAAE